MEHDGSSLCLLVRDINFSTYICKLREHYLDVYEGIQLEMNHVCKFDETADLATTS